MESSRPESMPGSDYTNLHGMRRARMACGFPSSDLQPVAGTWVSSGS